jgi:subtilisin family serine protease
VVNGFAAKLDAAQLRALRSSARVAYVEPDRVVTVAATQTMDAAGEPWGLDRIDQRNRPGSRTYTYNATGAGVTAYVVDTGISTSHVQFGGRAANVYDAFGGNGQDCHGHGTHVAGTIGAATWGVAKGVQLRGVRVLNCSGSGSTSGIVAALNWVRTNAVRPAVANMSLGGGFSSTLNTATTNLSNSGVFVAVAAGNESQNACNVSPASAAGAFTTAASDRNDRRAWFSNYGSCVEAYAPGVAIRSTWLSGGTNTISGTSMASPHVAGVGALYKQTSPSASSATISNWIISNSTTNVITANPSGTPNRLLYKSAL